MLSFPPEAQWAHITGGFSASYWKITLSRAVLADCFTQGWESTLLKQFNRCLKWKHLGSVFLPHRARGNKFSLWSRGVSAPEQEKNKKYKSFLMNYLLLGAKRASQEQWPSLSRVDSLHSLPSTPSCTVWEQWGILAAS